MSFHDRVSPGDLGISRTRTSFLHLSRGCAMARKWTWTHYLRTHYSLLCNFWLRTLLRSSSTIS